MAIRSTPHTIGRIALSFVGGTRRSCRLLDGRRSYNKVRAKDVFMKLTDRLCGMAALLAVTLQWSAGAEAGAPQQKTQAPGYYRFMLGEFEVTSLSDGIFQM